MALIVDMTHMSSFYVTHHVAWILTLLAVKFDNFKTGLLLARGTGIGYKIVMEIEFDGLGSTVQQQCTPAANNKYTSPVPTEQICCTLILLKWLSHILWWPTFSALSQCWHTLSCLCWHLPGKSKFINWAKSSKIINYCASFFSFDLNIAQPFFLLGRFLINNNKQ